MSPTWDWEPVGAYQRDKPRYDQAAALREAEEERRRTQEANRNMLDRILSEIGAFGRGTSGAISAGLSGRNPFLGGVQGVLGTDFPYRNLETTTSGILQKQLGMPAGPGIGPPNEQGDPVLNARGVLGFAGDIASDPLSYVPLGKLGQAARAIPGLGRVPQAAGYLGRAPEDLLTGGRIAMDSTRASRALGSVADVVPGVGGLVNRVSPKILDQTPELTRFRSGTAVGRDQIEAMLQPFEANRTLQALDRQSDVLIGGKPWNDAFQAGARGTPFENAADQVQRYFGDLNAAWKSKYAEMEAAGVPGDTLKNFAIKDAALEPGEVFVSRFLTKPDGTSAIVAPRSIGVKVGYQMDRIYPSVQDAVEDGWQTAGPIATMRIRGNQVIRKLNEMDMTIALKPKAIGRDLAAITAAGTDIPTARERLQNARGLQSVLARASRGEEVLQSTLATFRTKETDAIIDNISRSMSRKVSPKFKTAEARTEPGKAFSGFLDPERESVLNREAMMFAADTPHGMNLGRDAILEIRTPVQRKVFQQMQGELGKLVDSALSDVKGLRLGLEDVTSREAAKLVGREQAPGVAFLSGMFFDPADAKKIAAGLENAVNPIIKGAADVAAFPRLAQTGFDLGAAFIQGLPTMALHPDQFVKAFALSLRAFFQPEIRHQFLAAPIAQDVYKAFPNMGLAAGSREFFEDPRGLIGKTLGRLGAPGKAALGLGGRFQASFDMLGDALRVYGGAAWLPHVSRHPEDAQKIGAFLGHLSGTAERGASGISAQQQALERAVLFAPSYLASAFAVMGDMLQSGPVGAEARKTLADMLVTGLIGYERMAQATGQPAILDPGDSRFLSVEVGGTRVGVGSVWTALARTLGNIEARAEGVATGRIPPPSPSDILDPDNPFVKFWRGRASTPVGLLTDMLVGETYQGTPINNAVDVGKEALGRVAPFSVTGGVEAASRPGASAGDVAANVGASFIGLRAFPKTFQDTRNQIAVEKFGREFSALNTSEQAQVQADDRVQKLPIPPGEKYERSRATARAYAQYEEKVNKAADQVTAGRLNKDQFREQVSAAQMERHVLLTDAGPAKDRPLSPPEQTRRKYFELLQQKDEFGRVNYEAAEAFLAAAPPAHQAYIEARQEAGYEFLSPAAKVLMKDLNQARDILKPYREIRRQVMDERGIWDRWVAADPAEQVMIEREPAYRLADRLWTRRQEIMKRTNPEIRKALETWYGNVPLEERRRR